MNLIARTLTRKNDAPLNKDEKHNLFGRIGNLHVRLAKNSHEIERAQKLRFNVFHKEFGAQLSEENLALGLDKDDFDNHCDHLIVLDETIAGSVCDKIIGTYRLMQNHHAEAAGGYYSAHEFSVADLLQKHKERQFLELGRSCVLPAYRGKRTIELLWQGIWAYCNFYKVDVMMGCASFMGTSPEKHAEALSFLHHNALAKDAWEISPLPSRHVPMNLMPAEAINLRSALASLPPLIKGYLRLGALFGDGAVIDTEFNTIDVMVILPIENISARYRTHYGETAERFAGD